jgi:hypothetical protein
MSGEYLNIEDSVLIGHQSWYAPLSVSMPAFRQFTHRIDAQLRQLVARWAHAAAPNARAIREQVPNRRGRSR